MLEKLNYLHERLQEKGINLYYIIAPDKYDVNQPYITNNPYPPKTVLGQLEESKLYDLDWFINPGNEFRKMIQMELKIFTA